MVTNKDLGRIAQEFVVLGIILSNRKMKDITDMEILSIIDPELMLPKKMRPFETNVLFTLSNFPDGICAWDLCKIVLPKVKHFTRYQRTHNLLKKMYSKKILSKKMVISKGDRKKTVYKISQSLISKQRKILERIMKENKK